MTKLKTVADPPRATITADPAASQEDRLVQAMDEYRAALDAGEPLDQAALLARYPDIADELAACLDGLEFIHNVAPQLAEPAPKQSAASASEIRPTAALGDFQIIREIGRGGMGVVYEAEQLSLGRRVALKVLPFAAVMDPRQLARFKTEAQAAAHLQHQNIVPVFGVGCERGVHYYAMQFIEGQTLADVVSQLRRIEGLDGARGQGLGVRDQGSGISNPRRERKRAGKCPGVRGQGSGVRQWCWLGQSEAMPRIRPPSTWPADWLPAASPRPRKPRPIPNQRSRCLRPTIPDP